MTDMRTKEIMLLINDVFSKLFVYKLLVLAVTALTRVVYNLQIGYVYSHNAYG